MLAAFVVAFSLLQAGPSAATSSGLNGEFVKGVNLGGWLLLENWMLPEHMGGWQGKAAAADYGAAQKRAVDAAIAAEAPTPPPAANQK